MKLKVILLSIFLIIAAVFRFSRCMNRVSSPQVSINDRNIYSQEYGSYKSRYAQWEKKYGKSYVESLSEEDRAVFLKDVNCLTKITDEVTLFSQTTSWDSIKNDYLVISYPKNWSKTVYQGSTINYTFQPANPKNKVADEHKFQAELIGINNIKRLMGETNIEKEQLFPIIANVWWQQKANDNYDIRSIKKIKFLGFDAYQGNGQLVVGETRLASILYLINAPQGIYQFTIVGKPADMIEYAKTATNIIQTLNLLKEI